MNPIRNAAGWCFFAILLGTTAQIVPAVVVGHRPAVAEPMDCPGIITWHGVGSDLKTWTKEHDLCAIQ